MFVETVPNRNSPPAVLLRESYRDEQGRAQKRTLASKLPGDVIAALKAILRGGTVIGTGPGELEIERSLPHGHVAAALGMIRTIALDRLILSTTKDAASRRHCDLVVAMMVDRLIAPRSKLGFVRAVDEETAASSLGAVLGLGEVKEREAYEALDWLLARQTRIENGLARRHLEDGVLMLYDVSSSYFEGRCCPLAHYGHSRDHRGDRPQIVYGLLCTREGLPIAVEVFDGNTADPSTLSAQVEKVKDRFGIGRLVLVGDRGMVTAVRIRDDLKPAGLDWITCLRAPVIQALAAQNGPLQLSLVDERDLAEISAPDMFPGERLIVCRNRELAAERARKREDLLVATECELARIDARVRRKGSRLRSAAEIGMAVGAVLNSKKMAKHFDVEIGDGALTWRRRIGQIEEEARLDGIFVIRTSVPAEHLDAAETVQVYKDLSRVERAFRSLKTVDLEIRPIRHWTAPRVRAHVFLCMLAYHVEWHLRQAWAPLLFHDTELATASTQRSSPVAATEPSAAVKSKKATKRSADGHRVMSFADLIDLGTLVRNTTRVPARPQHRFTLYSTPTALQEAAFRLLALDPSRVQ
ncbi:IS1634 family transposase [Mesorhizobium sp. SARCC-RB16n]|uniref:IS1634 family transposase n=1 Tax=Mesorhizobium sp. SARCC-RB16n TaxID=2116687 RepID=UPI00122EC119|nr:IS1634 family transposase [Mesorhizobium sp. SARCC-RB16n]KAA3445850.1 IS1634 family transposase [Mesorhizobium sp. SARCC-RB16n]